MEELTKYFQLNDIIVNLRDIVKLNKDTAASGAHRSYSVNIRLPHGGVHEYTITKQDYDNLRQCKRKKKTGQGTQNQCSSV